MSHETCEPNRSIQFTSSSTCCVPVPCSHACSRCSEYLLPGYVYARGIFYIPCNIILFENVKRFGENPSKIENSESDTLKMRSCFMVPGMKMRHARTERNNLRTGTPTNNATNTVGSWKPDPRWSSPAHGSHAHLQRGRVPIGFLDRLGGPSASAHSSHARTLVWIRRTQEMT
jgi:hypothetical protein